MLLVFFFQNRIDEQLIMANTGLRSTDGVRCYKRIVENQKKTICSVLNSATNGQKSGTIEPNNFSTNPTSGGCP